MTASTGDFTLEVEKKFSKLRVYPLIINGGTPPFNSLTHLGIHSFRDIYYDRNNMLFSAGVWIRLRNGVWQSKAGREANVNESQFYESTDVLKIQRQIESITKTTAAPASEDFGLDVLADFTTEREMWKANGRFNIVLDRMNFGYTVGEVELEESLLAGTDAKLLGARMDADVVQFMQTYHWAFDTSPVVDKLTACLDVKKRGKEDRKT